MRFDELGLKEAVLEAVTESGYDTPTPIQAQAIPLVLEGRDVIGASQTGTGKTAAFALPSLSKIEPIGKPQILVLEPTRELADQVASPGGMTREGLNVLDDEQALVRLLTATLRATADRGAQLSAGG